MRRPRTLTAIALVLCALGVAGALEESHARTVTVAIVRDGPSEKSRVTELLKEHINDLVDPSVTVRFKEGAEFDAGWQGERAALVVRAALRDRSVDYIVGTGLLVTQAAADPSLQLTKPFISAFDQRADIPKLPFEGNGSLKKNLALVVIPQGAERDVEAFARLVRFNRLHVAIDPIIANFISGLETGLQQYERKLGIEIVPVMIGDDITEGLSTLPAGIEALYITSLPRLSDAQRRTLMDELNTRGIPTFSGQGHPDVEKGALAAITPDVSDLLARRVALNISRLVRGEKTSDLPVILSVDSKLLINGRTAAAIGWSPNLAARAYARYLYPEAMESDSKPLSLVDAVDQAQATNVTLAIKDNELEITRRDMQFARGFMLPQISANGDIQHSDPFLDSGLFPTDQTTAGITVGQMIYDDAVISDFRSSVHFYDGSVWDREVTRLDVVLEASTSYLLLAQSRVLYRIVGDNVEMTADNLQLSQIRYDVGYSGRDEVYRWEAQLAGSRGNLLSADSDVEADRVALNQILGVEQHQRWQTEDMTIEPESFEFIGIKLMDTFIDQRGTDEARNLWIQVALEQAPELRFFNKAVEAQGIQAGSRKRRFFIPTVSAGFRYNYFFNYEPELVGRNDDTWSVRVGATYPIFNGASRYYDMKRAQSELRGLENERELQHQLIERRVRTALRRLEATFPNIPLSRTAAKSSRLNLDVVQEKYAQGILNVTDLLEAQNASFTADQRATVAIYQFLVDFEEFQRSLAWYEREKTQAEIDKLAARVRRAAGLQ
ncbi:MAG: TolC family protein [Candidatus Krumholzibacteriota bacterium]|nr:TolC family protein [Candidatus Krumholzibacteriota bacterium]